MFHLSSALLRSPSSQHFPVPFPPSTSDSLPDSTSNVVTKPNIHSLAASVRSKLFAHLLSNPINELIQSFLPPLNPIPNDWNHHLHSELKLSTVFNNSSLIGKEDGRVANDQLEECQMNEIDLLTTQEKEMEWMKLVVNLWYWLDGLNKFCEFQIKAEDCQGEVDSFHTKIKKNGLEIPMTRLIMLEKCCLELKKELTWLIPFIRNDAKNAGSAHDSSSFKDRFSNPHSTSKCVPPPPPPPPPPMSFASNTKFKLVKSPSADTVSPVKTSNLSLVKQSGSLSVSCSPSPSLQDLSSRNYEGVEKLGGQVTGKRKITNKYVKIASTEQGKQESLVASLHGVLNGKSLALRKTKIKRSPGGTPQRTSRSPVRDPNNPAWVMRNALKTKFRSLSSDGNDGDQREFDTGEEEVDLRYSAPGRKLDFGSLNAEDEDIGEEESIKVEHHSRGVGGLVKCFTDGALDVVKDEAENDTIARVAEECAGSIKRGI